MALGVLTRRFTVDEFYRMAEAGIIKEGDRVELIEGQIVEMSPIGSRHAAAVDRGCAVWRRLLGERAIIRSQNPVRLDEHSEPEPDIALLRPRPDFYASAHPGAADVYVVVEVAETSYLYNRRVKLSMYARSGMAEVWLLDLGGRRLEVFRDPAPEGYRTRLALDPGATIAPLAFPDALVPVDDLLGA
jgi:Uma2 family endonuclease